MFLEWYSLLNTPYQLISGRIAVLSDAMPIPAMGALLLGLLGSVSPCQLTGNASAMAYVGQRAGDSRFTVMAVLAFIGGKAAVYTALGAVFILLGRGATLDLIPLVQVVRYALGPLFLLMGLWLLGLVRVPSSVPALSVPLRVQRRLAGLGVPGAFLLGLLLSLAFCPTLFLLFFGIMLPMAVATEQGYLFPGVFALGTSLPLVAFGALVVAGTGQRQAFMQRARRLDTVARRVAGLVLVAAGVNDTLVYWFL